VVFYSTVETVPKSREKKNTTLLKQFQNLEKKKYYTVETVPKSREKKIPHCIFFSLDF
jgi:hypothetical protein